MSVDRPSNPVRYEPMGQEGSSAMFPTEAGGWVRWEAVERLRHELDNERSAMRNVQECAESYRRERDWLIEERAKESRADSLVVLERERLRGALHEARHVMRWEMGYQDGGRNIANADKVCAKIDSLIGVADETKP